MECSFNEMPPKKDFQWSDDEVELLLNVTYGYKTAKAAKCTDWESVKNRYDMLPYLPPPSGLPSTYLKNS